MWTVCTRGRSTASEPVSWRHGRAAVRAPIGLALQGQKGVGKTHLLGGVRQIVQREGGYFFLVDLTTGAAFWEDVAEAMRSELLQKNDDGNLQLTELLRRLCDRAEVPVPAGQGHPRPGPADRR